MADASILFLTPIPSLEYATAMMHTYVKNSPVRLAMKGVAADAPDAGLDAMAEMSEEYRFDVVVAFGSSRNTLALCGIEDIPAREVSLAVVTIPGHTVPSLAVLAPGHNPMDWWLDHENVADFGAVLTFAITNRLMSLCGGLTTFQPEERGAWN